MVIAAGFSSIAQTTDSTHPQHKKFHKMDKHAGGQDFEKLNLADDQKVQIKTVNESFRQQMKGNK